MSCTNKNYLVDEENDTKIKVARKNFHYQVKAKLALNSLGSVKSLYVTKKLL